MKKFICFISILFMLFCQQIFALSTDDRKSIEQIVSDYTTSWNLHAGKGFAKNFTTDADFINIFAEHFKYKDEIEQRHIDILKSFLKDSTLTITNIELREPISNTVIAHVKWIIDGFRTPVTPSSQPGQRREGVFTQIFIYDGKKWGITASQNTMAPAIQN